MDSCMDTCTPFASTVLNIANLITLQFTVRQDDSLQMPEHAGSMLRGAFGVALRSLTCITDLPNCKDCPLKQYCKFPSIFEQPALQNKSVQAVNPYVIHVPIRSQLQSQLASVTATSNSHRVSASDRSAYTYHKDTYHKGDIWQFGMTLIGSTTTETALIIKAWQLALQTGLGAYAPYKRATLLRVTAGDHILYSNADYTKPSDILAHTTVKNSPHSSVTLDDTHRLNELWQQLQTTDVAARLTLRFLTPFRYQQDNRIVSRPSHLDSATFIASLYNRIRLCQDNHSPNQSWDIGYDSYHDFKDDIVTLDIEVDVAANHVARRSNRQQRKMELYGLQGDIHLSGDGQTLSRLLPALLLGEQLHIGKNTTMGLGQYRLIFMPMVH